MLDLNNPQLPRLLLIGGATLILIWLLLGSNPQESASTKPTFPIKATCVLYGSGITGIVSLTQTTEGKH